MLAILKITGIIMGLIVFANFAGMFIWVFVIEGVVNIFAEREYMWALKAQKALEKIGAKLWIGVNISVAIFVICAVISVVVGLLYLFGL